MATGATRSSTSARSAWLRADLVLLSSGLRVVVWVAGILVAPPGRELERGDQLSRVGAEVDVAVGFEQERQPVDGALDHRGHDPGVEVAKLPAGLPAAQDRLDRRQD